MKHIQRILYYICSTCRPNNSRTVRYAFPLTFVTLVLFGAAAVTSLDSSYIKLTSNNSQVEAGDAFTIHVYVGAHQAVNAVNIAVAFPEDQIKIEGIDTGQSVITIWTKEPYVEDGTVYISGGTFRKGFKGEHLVAEINARAKESGTAKFSAEQVQLLAGDGRGTTVSLKDTGFESYTMYVGIATEDGKSAIEGTVAVGIYTDIDGDGEVTMSDVMAFMDAWGSKTKKYDFNNDGKMSFVDFAIILADSFFK